MLTLSNRKDVKRVSNLKSILIIGSIIAIAILGLYLGGAKFN